MQQRWTRAARREKTRLWPNGTLYYIFDTTIDDILNFTIQQAMSTYEQLSCIQFAQQMNQNNYVRFRSRSDDGCSSHVGRKGGEQTIKLGPGCNRQHTILHELLHALGVWHEQSRPDRDSYVEIVSNNIQDGKEHNFLRRNTFQVDSQGEGYDYASVMHYRLDAFNKVDGLDTLRVTNQQLYEKQGSPDIGRLPTLSKSDVTQLNRLYNCQGSGVPGNLSVLIQSAQNLPPSNDPYVLVTAYDDAGQSESKVTKYFNDTGNPIWNERFDFGVRNNWQYVSVSIWDRDFTTSDDLLTYQQAFSVNPGIHHLQHCDTIYCYRTMSFSVSLQEVCHCLNGGVCCNNGHCVCAMGYGGPRCQYLRGNLSISVMSATNLVNQDNVTSNPYVVVLAFDHNGGVSERRTEVTNNTLNPVWNESLEFSENEWAWFTLQVFDKDYSSHDNILSYAYTYVLHSSLSSQMENLAALDGGSITFGYSMETLAAMDSGNTTSSYSMESLMALDSCVTDTSFSYSMGSEASSKPGFHGTVVNSGVGMNKAVMNCISIIVFSCLLKI